MTDTTPQTYVPPRRRSKTWVGAIIVTLLVLLVAALGYSITFGPEHYARAKAERVDGNQALVIGFPSAGTVTPAVSWSTRPIVTPLIDGLALFTNPAVYFGESPGVQLASPDGGIEVRIVPLTDRDTGTVLSDEGMSGTAVGSEVLASGLLVHHVDTGPADQRTPHGLVAVVESPSGNSVPLLVHAQLTGVTEHTLADYRPALGELLETMTLAHG